MPGRQAIGIGAAANDNTGDSIRTGGDKINDNFVELYDRTSVSVKAYGATGDGVTDDSAAFRSAVSALTDVTRDPGLDATGKRHYRALYIPEGIYFLNTSDPSSSNGASVKLPDGCTVYARNAIIVVTDTGLTAFELDGKWRGIFRDIVFQGGKRAIYFSGATGVNRTVLEVRGCVFEKQVDWAIETASTLTGGVVLSVEACNFVQTTAGAVKTYTDICTVRDSWIARKTTAGTENPSLELYRRMSVENCQFATFQTGSQNVYWIKVPAHAGATGSKPCLLRVNGCRFGSEDNGMHPVYWDRAFTTTNSDWKSTLIFTQNDVANSTHIRLNQLPNTVIVRDNNTQEGVAAYVQIADALVPSTVNEYKPYWYVQPDFRVRNVTGNPIALNWGIDNVCNVKEHFGALGNNSTDDTLAFQAAIDTAAAVSGDATVFVPTGTYKITATLNLAHRVHIVGTGPYNSQLRFSGTNLTGLKNASGTRLTEIAIRDIGILTNSNERHVLGLDLEDVSDSYFERVAILGASTGTGGRDGWRTAIKLHSNDSAKGSFRNRFNDCVIIGEAPSHDASDISFTSGTNTITSVTADFTADTFQVGQKIQISGTTGGTNDGLFTIATVGTTTMTTSEALTTQAAGPAVEITQIDAAKGVHSLSDGPANMGGNSCRFRQCTIVARGGDGVLIEDGNNLVFDACIFEGRTRRAVYISGPDGDNVVKHCRFENTNPNNVNTAIKIDSGDPRNLILGNTLGGLLATYVDNAEVSSRIEMGAYGCYHTATDAALTVNARTTGQYIVYPQIAANRIVTLPNGTAGSGKAWRNQRFSIIRNAATPGSFTLTVNNHDATSIKVIPNDTKARVDVYFDGTDWKLEGYQLL